MAMPASIIYIDAKARVVRALSRITVFVRTTNEYLTDQTSTSKRAKVETMLFELNDMRTKVEQDIQIMETAVGSKTAPVDVTDNTCSASLSDSFYNLYYDLASMAIIHGFSLEKQHDKSQTLGNSTNQLGNSSIYQLPKRKFPTFSGSLKEWQGFEDLFTSILSHTPDLQDVEKFEYLKTSLEGEALSLVAHLSLTSANYLSAWKILRNRYGNKRDLARIHFDALLAPQKITFTNAASIKHVINVILEHTAALDNLTFVTKQWGSILVHIFEKHLDYELRSRWELRVGENYSPQISDFVEFLNNHIRSAEVHPSSATATTNGQKPSGQNQKSTNRHHVSAKVLNTTINHTPSSTTTCPLCTHTHSIRKCPVFTNQSPTERFETTKKFQLCINCLGPRHSAATCISKHTCSSCHKKHHSLLHFPTKATTPEVSPPPTSMFVAAKKPQTVLLSTLLISIVSVDNQRHTLRALLDTGAQVSFITKQNAERLALTSRRSSTQVSAFSGASVNAVSGITSIVISAVDQPEPSIPLDVYIVQKITEPLPQTSFTVAEWPHLKQLKLADPTFNIQGPIDILLGADIASTILTGDRVAGSQSHPTAFGTIFGWVLMGPVALGTHNSVISTLITTETALEQSISKFWEIEEPPHMEHLSPDEVQAEAIFTSSVKRLVSGRFSVALPFKQPRPILGDSKGMALKRLHYLEHRLSRDGGLSQQYVEFMRDYLTSHHMEVVPINQRMTPYCYYIPHHCILRPESSTTKLRVVFDASATTTAGRSLNSSLYTGRKLQQDLPQILIRARVHKILFTADIKQMYRQIEIHPEDRDYLRILWRFERDQPVEEYRLRTVTYGTSCAPHQALRTLQHLAKIEENSYPMAAQIIMQDTFVDDILTGANTPEAALVRQEQLISLCARGHFQLRKWASNSSVILQSVPDNARSMSTDVLFDDELEAGLKILGMRWNPKQDHFSYSVQCPSPKTTKRSILSDLARIFDPLGLLAPTTFLAKHLMQLLWTSGIGWDDPIPEQILTIWQRYQCDLKSIQHLKIPRRITIDGEVKYELHAFSDSSEKGYAAAVYLRCDHGDGIQCHLITAKTKVAPLKRVTIPRLELCGAVLAAQLLHYVHEVLTPGLSIVAMHAWTDSTTTLAWIKSSPHKWATFVANRTSQLQSLTPPSLWRYVPTGENPVDCASRGLYPTELLQHPMWWSGPAFLSQDDSTWPSTSTLSIPDSTNLEIRHTTLLVTSVTTIFDQLFLRISSLPKIIRIVAFCIRSVMKVKPITIDLSPADLVHALEVVILAVQKRTFSDELTRLRDPHRKGISKLHGLNPFLDERQILRVGGRLFHADIPYTQKHPILLPRSHRFTDLLIDDFHLQHKHPGAKTLQSIIQQQYWIIASRQAIKTRLRTCITCYRLRPRSVQPIMGNLPKFRLQQIKPFLVTGVDYAGPITLKTSTTRRSTPCQAYICLFVCMTTKALHLELASDLSTETFLMALCRFISRRGPIEQIHSDCGTNFVGAANLFQTVDSFTQSTEYQTKCRDYLTTRNISWHFNPPSAPHFGGLWEAGVKSVKTLLYRTLGLQRLKYEELTTLLSRIEVTLNSRPLGALSHDPRDFEALTPSHFLTLMPSTGIVEPNLSSIPLSRYQRWRLIKDLHHHFWNRWQNEYLQTLQRRTKWSTNQENLKVDTLVLIREPTAPLSWKLGRIVQLHPGLDGIVRVATVQTQGGLLKRPTVKLCPLPIS